MEEMTVPRAAALCKDSGIGPYLFLYPERQFVTGRFIADTTSFVADESLGSELMELDEVADPTGGSRWWVGAMAFDHNYFGNGDGVVFRSTLMNRGIVEFRGFPFLLGSQNIFQFLHARGGLRIDNLEPVTVGVFGGIFFDARGDFFPTVGVSGFLDLRSSWQAELGAGIVREDLVMTIGLSREFRH
jgi:hypothetical protein